MYGPVPMLIRKTINDYKIPESNLVIPSGALTLIPIHAIHHDPDIYPNPSKFDPERFSDENKRNRHPMSFMPFGGGPRVCIGER
jgi:cytochrome P450 family 6